MTKLSHCPSLICIGGWGHVRTGRRKSWTFLLSFEGLIVGKARHVGVAARSTLLITFLYLPCSLYASRESLQETRTDLVPVLSILGVVFRQEAEMDGHRRKTWFEHAENTHWSCPRNKATWSHLKGNSEERPESGLPSRCSQVHWEEAARENGTHVNRGGVRQKQCLQGGHGQGWRYPFCGVTCEVCCGASTPRTCSEERTCSWAELKGFISRSSSAEGKGPHTHLWHSIPWHNWSLAEVCL